MPAKRRSKRGTSRVRKLASTSVKDTEKAISTIGEKHLRAGRIHIGTTRLISPTHRGMASVRNIAESVSKAGSFKSYSIDITIRYRTPDGTEKVVKRERIAIPRYADIRKYKGETKKETFRRIVAQTAIGTVYRQLSEDYRLVASPPIPKKGTPMTKAAARKLLNEFKRRRKVRFSVALYRETGRIR